MDEQEFFRKLATLRKGALIDVVRIRAEKNKDVIKKFNASEREIYNKWQNRKYENRKEYTKEELIEAQRGAQEAFKLWAEAQRKQNK